MGAKLQLGQARVEAPLGHQFGMAPFLDDAAAVQAHRDSAHFKELGAPLGPLLSARTEVERLDVV